MTTRELWIAQEQQWLDSKNKMVPYTVTLLARRSYIEVLSALIDEVDKKGIPFWTINIHKVDTRDWGWYEHYLPGNQR